MHVTIIYRGSLSGENGTSERILQIANRLVDCGIQVTLSGDVRHSWEVPDRANLQVIPKPNNMIRFHNICMWVVQLVARGLTHKYDIVQLESFSFLQSLALFLVLHPCSRKFVIVFHDKYFEQDPRKKVNGRFLLALQRILLTLFDASITPGLSVRKWFQELHGELVNKMIVIPNGAPNFLSTKDTDHLLLREKYGMDSKAFLALFFGSMAFKPNYDAAMYLFNVSSFTSEKFQKNTGRKLIFVVAGAGSKTLPKTDHYIPLGFVNELDELLSLPDIIVFPQLPSYSGPHVKTIYAFLSKKPVVASKDAVKDMPYVKARKHFLPFDIDDPNTLLKSLIELYSNKEWGNYLALNAYLYSEKFSWEYISSIHLKLYEDLTS